jgi:septal ring factor EnvC (AmiA/AmiB activator)
VNADIAALQAQADARRSNPDRLQREAFRLIDLPPSAVPANLSAPQQEALDELRALSSGLQAEQQRLSERSATLGRLDETVAAKRADLDRARVRAQSLAAATASGDSDTKQAEVAVLRSLANDVANSQTSLALLVASSLGKTSGTASQSWVLPVRGVITQTFGPTAFELEPPAVYRGCTTSISTARSTSRWPSGCPWSPRQTAS